MKSIASLLIAAALAAPAMSSLAQEAHGDAPPKAAPAAEAAKPDLKEGAAKFGGTCAACHGPDANSLIPTNPTLAQQHPEYLIKQLQEFKSGKRANPIMQGMAAILSDADMKNIAYWANSQKAKPGAAKDKDLVMLGERIYRGGIADKQVAACAGCHSPNGAGIPAQFPRLSGQQTDYVVTQLKAFRTSAAPTSPTDAGRANSPQMTQIAARMNDREINAVADYISGLR